MSLSALPGADLVEEGIDDLVRGVVSVASLLVSIGRPRLIRGGIAVPESAVERPEVALYELLAAEDARTAHSRYNALIRRLVSFERALGCAS